MRRNRGGACRARPCGANFRDHDHCERQELAAAAAVKRKRGSAHSARLPSIGAGAVKLELMSRAHGWRGACNVFPAMKRVSIFRRVFPWPALSVLAAPVLAQVDPSVQSVEAI